MRHAFIVGFALAAGLLLVAGLFAVPALAKPPIRTQLYYDGRLVDAIIPVQGDGSDVEFKPLPPTAAAYPFDPIYVFVDSATGMPHAQAPVIGSVPGDRDYTGGRWHVTLVFGTTAADPDITSVGDLKAAGLDMMVTDKFFECPVVGK